jgi:hypothetical protein
MRRFLFTTAAVFVACVLPSGAEPQRSTGSPDGVGASGREAYNALRRIFDKLGYQDFPGPHDAPLRYETRVRSFDPRSCVLIIDESRNFNPNFSYAERHLETTYLELRELDVDEIKPSTQPMNGFPPGSAFIEVPAAGPGIRVEVARFWGETPDKRAEAKPDRVHFYLRYPKMADEAARALQVLARSCGAR